MLVDFLANLREHLDKMVFRWILRKRECWCFFTFCWCSLVIFGFKKRLLPKGIKHCSFNWTLKGGHTLHERRDLPCVVVTIIDELGIGHMAKWAQATSCFHYKWFSLLLTTTSEEQMETTRGALSLKVNSLQRRKFNNLSSAAEKLFDTVLVMHLWWSRGGCFEEIDQSFQTIPSLNHAEAICFGFYHCARFCWP